MVAQSEAFQKAVVDSKKLTSKPSNEDLLEIYGAPYRGVLRQSTVLTYCPSPL
jgi:acyl-CoA-binding protein